MATQQRQSKTAQARAERVAKQGNQAPAFIFAVGRRKEAIARVRLYPKGSGKITINGKPSEEYFAGPFATAIYSEPLRLTNTREMFDITIRVVGSGPNGQLGAVTHAIARAIQKFDKEQYRAILKKKGLLTRDPRAKERRKAGFAHKARAKKSSPKR